MAILDSMGRDSSRQSVEDQLLERLVGTGREGGGKGGKRRERKEGKEERNRLAGKGRM